MHWSGTLGAAVISARQTNTDIMGVCCLLASPVDNTDVLSSMDNAMPIQDSTLETFHDPSQTTINSEALIKVRIYL